MKIKKILSLLRECYPNLKPFIGQNIAFIVSTELVVVLTLLVPLIIKFLLDDILVQNRWDIFPVFVVCMIIAIVMSKSLSIATNILYGRFSANIEARARNLLFSCILKKNMEFFSTTADGEIVDRLMRSSEQLHTIPSIYLERIISSITTFLIVSIILLSIHPVMAIFSLVSVPVFIWVYLKTRSLFFYQVQMAREESGKLTDFYLNIIRNIKQVKNYCSESNEQKESEDRNNIIRSLCLRYSITGAFISNCVQIITQFNQLGVLIYGSLLIRNGQITIGTLVAFYSYLELLYQPIISVIQALYDMSDTLVGIERYLEYFNQEYEEDYDSNKVEVIRSNSIDFCDVSFSYGSQPIFKNISFHIGDSEKVLICGKSGIGKSTIVSLIKRFYPCSNGYIEIGGQNINYYNLVALRKNIAYMTQENYFYPTTIKENFIRINPNISDAEIDRILCAVRLYHDIYGFKMGLNTSLEKNAVTFSGGQRRRLNLALVLASTAPIVILDEPFIGIDKNTQDQIWLDIRELFHNKTVIVIDHHFRDKNYFNKIIEIDGNNNVVIQH